MDFEVRSADDVEVETLRDEFAKAALRGLLSSPHLAGQHAHESPSQAAKLAYQYADAMLKARSKK